MRSLRGRLVRPTVDPSGNHQADGSRSPSASPRISSAGPAFGQIGATELRRGGAALARTFCPAAEVNISELKMPLAS